MKSSVIDACREFNRYSVFFDNFDSIPFTQNRPVFGRVESGGFAIPFVFVPSNDGYKKLDDLTVVFSGAVKR